MSFKETKDKIEYGDTVILHIGYNNMIPLIIKKGETHQTKFGAVKHDAMVGMTYGTRVQCPKGWICTLHPTPELWTLCLPHRTQILYSTDISMIIYQLDLKPGSVVAEAGTGSGSLSHAMLRTVLPTGRLLTFEFHKERSEKALEEFTQHQLKEFVTVTHRDVCGEGFQLNNEVDAVFLDLPKPWECIKSAKDAIKKEGGRLCTFSPCIEQVQRSCDELVKNGFTDITTVECLARNFNIQKAKLQNINLDDGAGDTFSIENENSGESNPKVMKMENTNLDSKQDKKRDNNSIHCFSAAVPVIGMQGHTGFLTFASIYSQ
ncbi:unnamed protein product [Lymnaea stagnalis]|uniref:tRNA (adenine(58)-N(1))-methyltransferase catalytic subunit TRMT61A n=1 Tax=Lymnaea stagnalis TaxID=6523 RepID=A0AAV2H1T4_LYMST